MNRIWFILIGIVLMFPSVFAANPITDWHGQTLSTDAGADAGVGEIFNCSDLNVNRMLNHVTLAVNYMSDYNRVALVNWTNKVGILNVSVNNYNATFPNSTLRCLPGYSWVVMAYKAPSFQTATTAMARTVAGGYPLRQKNVNWIARSSPTFTTATTVWDGIYSVTTTNVSAAPAAVSNNVSIVARDKYNSSMYVKSFNVTVRAGSKTYNLTTLNGSVIALGLLVNYTKPVNFTFASNFSGGYFPKIYKNINVSINQTFVGRMFQAEVRFIPKYKIRNTAVTGGLFVINTKLKNNASNNAADWLRAGTYNISYLVASHYNLTRLFTISAKTNTTQNFLGVYNKRVNVVAKSGTTTINGATYNVSYKNGITYSETQTPATNASFNLVTGNYTIKVTKPGSYVGSNATLNTFTKSIWSMFNITLYTWNTFNITIMDEETLNAIFNSTLTITSPTYGNHSWVNKTLDKGTASLGLLSPNQYFFLYGDKFNRYDQRIRYITLLNGTYNSIQLYLLNATHDSSLTLTIQDQYSTKAINKVVAALKYIPYLNSYIIVGSDKTNDEGKVQFALQAGNSLYKFRILDTDGITQLYETNSSRIFDTTRTITMTSTITSGISQTAYNVWQVRTQLYNKSTIIVLKWNTLSGTPGKICLNITRTNVTAYQRISNACSSSSSGNMTYNFSAYSQGRINAVAYVEGSLNLLDSLSVLLNKITEWYDNIGLDGYVVYMLLIIVGAAVSIANVQTLPFSLAVVHIASWYLGLIPGSLASLVCIVAALILVMMRMEK